MWNVYVKLEWISTNEWAILQNFNECLLPQMNLQYLRIFMNAQYCKTWMDAQNVKFKWTRNCVKHERRHNISECIIE